MSFSALRLAEPIVRAVSAKGYTTTTDIQAGAIPPAMEGRDVLGTAQTGTGKTCAFALPILHRLSQRRTRPQPRIVKGQERHRRVSFPRALVLCPTRELATQIHGSFKDYGNHVQLKFAVVYGGVKQYHQVRSMRHGVDVLVATPGRLKDLVQQKLIDLSAVETLVLDEADRMLDMGFIADIRQIEAMTRKNRQTLLFSATISESIRKLAGDLMRNPEIVETAPEATTVDSVEQRVIVVGQPQKIQLLAHVLGTEQVHRALVFTRTKHGADKVTRRLQQCGIAADAIHSNKSQSARNSTMQGFRSGDVQVLVATDIASRGIDVQSVTHVINFDMPIDPETYVHRIGRTARAGASGKAITFCCHDQRKMLRAIERRANITLPAAENLPTMAPMPRSTGAATSPVSESTSWNRSDRKSYRGAKPSWKSGGGKPAAGKKKYAKRSGGAPYKEGRPSWRSKDEGSSATGNRTSGASKRPTQDHAKSQRSDGYTPAWREDSGGSAAPRTGSGGKRYQKSKPAKAKKPGGSRPAWKGRDEAMSQSKTAGKKKFTKGSRGKTPVSAGYTPAWREDSQSRSAPASGGGARRGKTAGGSSKRSGGFKAKWQNERSGGK
jgi:ATP-dependent RNA helicase RhlE